MNLIEQLGGYEKSKVRLNGADVTLSFYKELNYALLQYRRDHNIFEVGDGVILLDAEGDGESRVFKIFSLNQDDAVAHLSADYINSDGINLHHGISGQWLENMRHATPEEIKAGHRL